MDGQPTDSEQSAENGKQKAQVNAQQLANRQLCTLTLIDSQE